MVRRRIARGRFLAKTTPRSLSPSRLLGTDPDTFQAGPALPPQPPPQQRPSGQSAGSSAQPLEGDAKGGERLCQRAHESRVGVLPKKIIKKALRFKKCFRAFLSWRRGNKSNWES